MPRPGTMFTHPGRPGDIYVYTNPVNSVLGCFTYFGHYGPGYARETIEGMWVHYRALEEVHA